MPPTAAQPLTPHFPRLQVFATVDPSKGYKGISCFVVEKEMGVQIAKKEKKVRPSPLGALLATVSGVGPDHASLSAQLGIRASSTCTLAFDDVKVPAENLLGEEGTGYKLVSSTLCRTHDESAHSFRTAGMRSRS